MCFLWGTNWNLIYYLEEIQSLKDYKHRYALGFWNRLHFRLKVDKLWKKTNPTWSLGTAVPDLRSLQALEPVGAGGEGNIQALF
jgi:hypothetical protein